MIIKSFLRKKSTKLYLIIIILILEVMVLLKYGYDFYSKKYNENFENSFIYVNENILEFNENNNIYHYEKTIKIENFFFIIDDTLIDNYVIIPEVLKSSYNINDIIIYNYKNAETRFIVKDFYYRDKGFLYIYCSKDFFENYYMDMYLIKLKDWRKSDEYKNDFEIYEVYINKKDNYDYENYINIFNVFVKLLIIIYAIVLTLIILNIYKDEKNKNEIYLAIGYDMKKIMANYLLKVFIIIFLSSIPAIITLIILK